MAKGWGGFLRYPLLPVVLPIPHQAFKARSLWHRKNVDEGSRHNEGVSLVEALALKDATGLASRRRIGEEGHGLTVVPTSKASFRRRTNGSGLTSDSEPTP